MIARYVLCLTAPAHAYVDLAPTLAKVISDSKKIAVVEVVEFNREKRVVVLKEIRSLKGESSSERIRHEVAVSEGAAIPRQILQWAAPARGASSSPRETRPWSVLVRAGTRCGRRAPGRGSSERIARTCRWPITAPCRDWRRALHLMLGGKEAVITVVAHGADNEGASFDMALNRSNLPGLVRVERIRANMQMPGMVMAASANPAYLVGAGPVDEGDLAALIEGLRSPEATVRMEAADDLRCLGRKAVLASAPLTELLSDPSLQVRLSAAAAMLQIDSKEVRAIEVLARGLASTDLADRRDAAKAIGLAGPAAATLVGKLSPLLNDSDESMRITVLQTISMLGPAAAQAADAVAPLLDDPALAIDAADALGRIGSAARPAMKRLAQMLSADQAAVRWAAVRAMSQIGGEEARPAVDFMVRSLRVHTEVEGYNMMIYFALWAGCQGCRPNPPQRADQESHAAVGLRLGRSSRTRRCLGWAVGRSAGPAGVVPGTVGDRTSAC